MFQTLKRGTTFSRVISSAMGTGVGEALPLQRHKGSYQSLHREYPYQQGILHAEENPLRDTKPIKK